MNYRDIPVRRRQAITPVLKAEFLKCRKNPELHVTALNILRAVASSFAYVWLVAHMSGSSNVSQATPRVSRSVTKLLPRWLPLQDVRFKQCVPSHTPSLKVRNKTAAPLASSPGLRSVSMYVLGIVVVVVVNSRSRVTSQEAVLSNRS
jgi:hypothetical protein